MNVEPEKLQRKKRQEIPGSNLGKFEEKKSRWVRVTDLHTFSPGDVAGNAGYARFWRDYPAVYDHYIAQRYTHHLRITETVERFGHATRQIIKFEVEKIIITHSVRACVYFV